MATTALNSDKASGGEGLRQLARGVQRLRQDQVRAVLFALILGARDNFSGRLGRRSRTVSVRTR